ncbi:MAG: hypothetical protein HY078_16065 [Elusimicrobia bacterium]|nr:hypothetical protein [Elusimicrobiota bacterium]
MMIWLLTFAAIAAVFFFLRRPRGPVLRDLPEGALGSKTNPVKCENPAGELEYLLRLRGPDGQGAGYRRLGSVEGAASGHMLDAYAVASGDGALLWKVYMDMYVQDYRETRPIDGFALLEKTDVPIPGLDPAMKDLFGMLRPKPKNSDQ